MLLSPRSLAIASAALVAAVAAVPTGCRAVVGIDERAETCGGGLEEGACGDCQAQACCEYARACADTPDCARFSECRASCLPSDELCPGRCANEHPEGASLKDALASCARRLCSETCGSWSCVGNVVWPPPPLTATITLQFRDVLDRHPPEGLTVTACTFAHCSDKSAQTDASGAVKLTLVQPADSFVRVSGREVVRETVDGGGGDGGAVTKPGRSYQGLMFFAPHAQAQTFVRMELLSIEAGLQLTAGANVDLTSNGAIIMTARDCDGLRASHVRFALEPAPPAAQGFYTEGLLPVTSLDETADGNGGFWNVPPGPIAVKARATVAGVELGTRRLLVEPGSITYLDTRPMPDSYR